MYPAFLENFWLARARIATGAVGDTEALEKIRPAVQRLSDLFTTERPDGTFPDYAADPALLAAYGLFFFPQSFVRARIALDQPVRFRHWHPTSPDASAPLRILDLGSGTGPCGLAAALALHAMAPTAPLVLTALDHAPAALATLRELAPALPFGSLDLVTHAVDLCKAAATLATLPQQHLIVAGFAANELFGTDDTALRTWLTALRAQLAPGGLLLVLEPALRNTATTLQRAADALVSDGTYQRWAPDLSNAPCPLLAEKKFWNHEVRRWTAPESLAFLNRHLFRDIGVLKFSYTALGVTPPAPLPETPQPLRLVSPLEPLKGRLVCAVVTAEGKKLALDIPTRGLSKSEVKAQAAHWERGDIFGVSTLRPLGQEGFFRVDATSELAPLYRLHDD